MLTVPNSIAAMTFGKLDRDTARAFGHIPVFRERDLEGGTLLFHAGPTEEADYGVHRVFPATGTSLIPVFSTVMDQHQCVSLVPQANEPRQE